jgi:hypothetical protein
MIFLSKLSFFLVALPLSLGLALVAGYAFEKPCGCKINQ